MPNISRYLDFCEQDDSDLMESESKSIEEKAEALRRAFGRQIKEAREVHGYTQAQLASMTGLHKYHISKLERGTSFARPEKMMVLSDLLGIDFTFSARNGYADEPGPKGPDTPLQDFRPG